MKNVIALVLLACTTLLFGGLALYYRFYPVCPEADPETVKIQRQIIHMNDSIIHQQNELIWQLEDSLTASSEKAKAIHKLYEKTHMRISNADARQLDSLWTAFGLE